MYLVDREALIRHGRPVTFDRLCSLRNGPILSHTLNLINGQGAEPGLEYWKTYIGSRWNHSVALRALCEPEDLSPAEESIIDEVFDRYGSMAKWRLRDLSHSLPEWTDPGTSAIPIEYQDILHAVGFADDEIDAIIEDMQAASYAERVFGAGAR
jgi:hypothetical protein